jgi:glycosyltransferase involved in cell wall biosynthesis
VAAPLVLTIHDVSYFAHPEWFSFREGFRRRSLTAWSARRARAVITDSQFSRSEIQRYLGINPSRVRSIPLGITGGVVDDSVRDGAMVLFVGSILARRRIDRLIAAFDDVIDRVPAATLQIVGDNRTPGLDLEALRNRAAHPERITLRSYVDDATLADLYRRATVFAFLSEYEGFGFTPLEAMTHGAVPVVLDTGIARETYGDAARYVDPDASEAEMASAIAALLTRPGERSALRSKAAGVLRRYDWARTASQTLEVLEEAAIGR